MKTSEAFANIWGAMVAHCHAIWLGIGEAWVPTPHFQATFDPGVLQKLHKKDTCSQ